jgi:hypothetical protein
MPTDGTIVALGNCTVELGIMSCRASSLSVSGLQVWVSFMASGALLANLYRAWVEMARIS